MIVEVRLLARVVDLVVLRSKSVGWDSATTSRSSGTVGCVRVTSGTNGWGSRSVG
jgi:hypothetical protein